MKFEEKKLYGKITEHTLNKLKGDAGISISIVKDAQNTCSLVCEAETLYREYLSWEQAEDHIKDWLVDLREVIDRILSEEGE